MVRAATIGVTRLAEETGRAGRVGRRRVFYIPGYDPFPPRRYRELYRTEGAEQARISGYDIAQAPAAIGRGRFGWQVTAGFGAAPVVSEIEVLVWTDIVRASMGQGIVATYLQLAHTVWAYVGSGAIFRVMRLRKGPTIAALYPIAVLLLQLALALLAGWLLALFAGRLMALAGAPAALGWVLAPLAVYGLLWRFRKADGRIFAYYLMHDYAFTASGQGAYPPALDQRIAVFTDRIREALAADWDEVLVVGHSSGAHIGVSVLADLLRAGPLRPDGPALALLTLGHVVPMASFLPKAARLRGDLAFLSARPDLTWVDVTAPGDGCAFALCDPVAVTGVSPEGKRWPLVLSAAFTQTLSPERWQALRRRFFRLHFQYLCAFDRPGDYDYFRITAGPVTLADRFRGRSASKSRIETPVNPYRSVR